MPTEGPKTTVAFYYGGGVWGFDSGLYHMWTRFYYEPTYGHHFVLLDGKWVIAEVEY